MLWNMETFKLKGTLEEHNLMVTDVRFSGNSTRLATSSFDKTVKVWEVDSVSAKSGSFFMHVYVALLSICVDVLFKLSFTQW
jgi:WD40 repeat protein